MSNHPLDISGLLKPKQNATSSKESPDSYDNGDWSAKDGGIRIKSQYWEQLNLESRRMLTSRIWKHVDFNPMLAELDDLSRITEKWLKWAVPTYVNGIQGGPIKDWFDGVNQEKDFHYILVGEHLRHLKELREKKKAEEAHDLAEVSGLAHDDSGFSHDDSAQREEVAQPLGPGLFKAQPPSPVESEDLQTSIKTLDDHIRWFKQYLKERELIP